MRRGLPEFTSDLTPKEYGRLSACAAIYFIIMPLVSGMLLRKGSVTVSGGNTLCYGITLAYVLTFFMDFYRREFDALCERPGLVIREVLLSYGAMYCFNLITDSIISFSGNPNNNSIQAATGTGYRELAAVAVFMAPLIEELLFRAGLFNMFRKKSRVLAYIVSTLFFALYHVMSYALVEPSYWIYLIQYLPVSFLLCRVYERTNTIWSSVFFHMLVNAIAIFTMKAMA